MIEFLFFTLFVCAGFFLLYFLKKETILELKNIWSILFYKEAFFILLPVILLSFLNFDEFSEFNMVDQKKVFFISVIVLLSFFVFTYVFLFLSRFFVNTKAFNFSIEAVFCNSSVDLFSVVSILSGIALLAFSIAFFGYKHAIISSLLLSENILHIRLQNVYSSGLPSQISYMITVSYWIAAIYSALLAIRAKYFRSFVFFTAGILLSSAGGEKAPIVNFIIYFFMSYFYFLSFSASNKSGLFYKFFLFLPVYLFIIFSILYYVVSLQIPNLNLNIFFLYLFERLGVGQMTGVYETFSISFFVPDSAWHMLPFSSLFVEYPIFSKELMLFTENREFADTGVKNSLFIAEAYGMGGWMLMILSPIWMAFAYLIKFLILSFFLRVAFGVLIRNIYLIPLFFLSTSLTGDFSSLALQKGTILLLLNMMVFYVIIFLVKKFKRLFLSSRKGFL